VNVGNENPMEVEVVSDTMFTAIFDVFKYQLEVIANEGGVTAPFGTKEVDCGSKQELTAIPHEGYKFLY